MNYWNEDTLIEALGRLDMAESVEFPEWQARELLENALRHCNVYPPEPGDIIAFEATSGHPVYGEDKEFIGRVQRDAHGLHAANYYQFAWKNPRILERAKIHTEEAA